MAVGLTSFPSAGGELSCADDAAVDQARKAVLDAAAKYEDLRLKKYGH